MNMYFLNDSCNYTGGTTISLNQLRFSAIFYQNIFHWRQGTLKGKPDKQINTEIAILVSIFWAVFVGNFILQQQKTYSACAYMLDLKMMWSLVHSLAFKNVFLFTPHQEQKKTLTKDEIYKTEWWISDFYMRVFLQPQGSMHVLSAWCNAPLLQRSALRMQDSSVTPPSWPVALAHVSKFCFSCLRSNKRRIREDDLGANKDPQIVQQLTSDGFNPSWSK